MASKIGAVIAKEFREALPATIFGGLFLYCLAAELVRSVGAQKVKEILLGRRAEGAEC